MGESLIERVLARAKPGGSEEKSNAEGHSPRAQPKKNAIQTKENGRKGADQPKVGTSSRAKGKVEWKFGGHLCYGTLIPGKETKTHLRQDAQGEHQNPSEGESI